ncbi:MAG: hypothetical protein P8Y67_09505 [Alphaproteobacteria bacterium]
MESTSIQRIFGAAALAGAFLLGGCGSAGGVDLQIDAPVLNAVGLNLSGKAKDESDLPERPGLVVPPSTSSLPEPGERTGTAAQSWPVDADNEKKKVAEAKAAAREKYCAEGDWGSKSDISEFEKATGRQQRCPSKLGKALSKSFGGRPAED